MADKKNPENEESVQAGHAYSGKPRRLDQEAVRSRAETPALLPRQRLHERQSALGERRKPAGPALRQESREGRPEIKAPEVAPTECEEPPGYAQEEDMYFQWGDEEIENEEGTLPLATR